MVKVIFLCVNMAGKPTLGEITQADHGILVSKAYTHMLMENPDSVLKQRDRDMRLYDELLRDDLAPVQL